jgi:hypothetical protein
MTSFIVLYYITIFRSYYLYHEGNDNWKADDNSEYFDAPLIRERLNQLHDAMNVNDRHKLANILRTGILIFPSFSSIYTTLTFKTQLDNITRFTSQSWWFWKYLSL